MPMYGLWLLVVPLPAFSLSRCCLQSHLLLDLELQAGINNVLRLQLYRLLSEKRNRLSLLYMCFDNVCSRMAQSLLSEEKQQKVIARKYLFLICTFQISILSIIVVAFYLFGLICTTLDVLPFLSIWLCILEFLNKDDRCVAFRLRELFGLLGGPVMLLLVDLVRFWGCRFLARGELACFWSSRAFWVHCQLFSSLAPTQPAVF